MSRRPPISSPHVFEQVELGPPAQCPFEFRFLKVAVTVWAVLMLTVQGSVPVQAPLQPMKPKFPEPAVAVRVTHVLLR